VAVGEAQRVVGRERGVDLGLVHGHDRALLAKRAGHLGLDLGGRPGDGLGTEEAGQRAQTLPVELRAAAGDQLARRGVSRSAIG
jgi:hypothetical protein